MSKPLLKPTETTDSEPVTDSLDWTAHNNCAHIPNAETIAAMEEADEIIKKAKKEQNSSLSLNEFFEELGI